MRERTYARGYYGSYCQANRIPDLRNGVEHSTGEGLLGGREGGCYD